MQCISSSRPSPSPDVLNSSPHFEDSVVRSRERPIRIPSDYSHSLEFIRNQPKIFTRPDASRFSVVTPSRSYFHLFLAITVLIHLLLSSRQPLILLHLLSHSFLLSFSIFSLVASWIFSSHPLVLFSLALGIWWHLPIARTRSIDLFVVFVWIPGSTLFAHF